MITGAINQYKHEDFLNGEGLRVAIVCGNTNHNNSHTGLLLKQDGLLKVLHFGWHEQLAFEDMAVVDFFKSLCWLEFDYFRAENDPGDLKKQVLIMWAYNVFENCKDTIPYGINYFGDEIGFDDFILHLTPETVGLTCATFLLAFFKGYGLELVKYLEWPLRSGDKEMQEKTIEVMKITKVPANHIAKVANEKIKARFLPEEVTASCSCDSLPAGFLFCEPLGIEINSFINK